MDFRILGPLEVSDKDRSLRLAGDKLRALLALLLLHPNERLSNDRLIEGLWGDSPPAAPAKSLQVHVSRLRRALEQQTGNGSGPLLVTREHGYELRVDPESVDVYRFERLLAEGRRQLRGGRPLEAVTTLEKALSLCRGPPLSEFAYEPFARAEIGRLTDLHMAAIEELIEAKLALGRHDEVVEELELLVAEQPYRERLRAQLMLALYRSDRQAGALQAYQDARRALIEGLGIEPGRHLRELEQAILRQDQALATPAPGVPAEDSARSEAPGRSTRGGRGRSRILALLIGGALVVGASAVVILLSRGSDGGGRSGAPALRSATSSVVALDMAGRHSALAIPVPGRPTDVAASGGTAWITTVDSAAVTSVDAMRGSIARTVPMTGRPDAVAIGQGSVWVADGRSGELAQLKPGYESVLKRIKYPRASRSSVAVGGDGVWITNGSRNLIKVRPSTGRVSSIPVGRAISGVAFGAGAVWALSPKTSSVLRVDPVHGAVTDTIRVAGRRGVKAPSPIGIAATNTSVWVLNGNSATVTRIDPVTRGIAMTTHVGVDRVPSEIAASGGSAWVAGGDGTLSRVDSGGAARAVRVGGSLESVAVDGANVWVTATALDQKLPGRRG